MSVGSVIGPVMRLPGRALTSVVSAAFLPSGVASLDFLSNYFTTHHSLFGVAQLKFATLFSGLSLSLPSINAAWQLFQRKMIKSAAFNQGEQSWWCACLSLIRCSLYMGATGAEVVCIQLCWGAWKPSIVRSRSFSIREPRTVPTSGPGYAPLPHPAFWRKAIDLKAS